MPDRTEDEVRAQIRELVRELAPSTPPAVTAESLLVEDLEYHSLALLELAFALEDEFDLPPIDEESASNIRSAKDIEDFVVQQLAAKTTDAPVS